MAWTAEQRIEREFALHAKWLHSALKRGQRADFCGANLSGQSLAERGLEPRPLCFCQPGTRRFWRSKTCRMRFLPGQFGESVYRKSRFAKG